jgi:hypothetical protein
MLLLDLSSEQRFLQHSGEETMMQSLSRVRRMLEFRLFAPDRCSSIHITQHLLDEMKTLSALIAHGLATPSFLSERKETKL